MSGREPLVVGLGGTTRANSSGEKALRYSLRAADEMGAKTIGYYGPELATLPMYAPELPERTDLAQRLVADLRNADAVIISAPAYHGVLSGLVKNALDYTQDMMTDDKVYFAGRAVGCIAVGAGWQGIVNTLGTLRMITHSLRGWPTPMGAAINSLEPIFGEDGDVTDEKVAFQLRTVAQECVDFARMHITANG